MLRRFAKVTIGLMKRHPVKTAFATTTATVSGATFINRRIRLQGDHVLNPRNLPILNHIEQYKDTHSRVPRWETDDKSLLKIAEQFPTMPINLKASTPTSNPSPKPISIHPMKNAPPEVQKFFAEEKGTFIGVGGPLPAIGVLQKSIEGVPAVLITNGESHRKPADHIQTDAVNEAPAYTAGKTVPWFAQTQIREFFFPSRFDTDVTRPDFNVFSLNVSAWAKNPGQWINGIQVALGNYKISRQYEQDKAMGIEPAILEYTRQRMRVSRNYLDTLSEYQPGILRPSHGSITVVATENATTGNESDSKAFEKEGLEYKRITPDQAKAVVGFTPRNAHSVWRNSHDRIAHDDFRENLNVGIKAHGGKVELGDVTTVYDDTVHNRGGVVTYEDKSTGELKNYKYTKLVLSVGNTQFTGPNKRAEIAVAGISSDIIVFRDLPMPTIEQEIPIMIDGPTHIIPQQSKIISDTDPATGKTRERVATWYRGTTGGDVRPLVASDGSFNPRHAVHAIHRISETLPAESEMAVVRVEECLRIIDEGALQHEKHALVEVDGTLVQSENIIISGVAGGGGLTSMGVLQGSREVAIVRSKLEGNSSTFYAKGKTRPDETLSPSHTLGTRPK